MKLQTTIKKTRSAEPYVWGDNVIGGVAETAQYTVSVNGHAVMVVDGGSYGYMERPNWSVRNMFGETLGYFPSYATAKAWALSDAGVAAWMDRNRTAGRPFLATAVEVIS